MHRRVVKKWFKLACRGNKVDFTAVNPSRGAAQDEGVSWREQWSSESCHRTRSDLSAGDVHEYASLLESSTSFAILVTRKKKEAKKKRGKKNPQTKPNIFLKKTPNPAKSMTENTKERISRFEQVIGARGQLIFLSD